MPLAFGQVLGHATSIGIITLLRRAAVPRRSRIVVKTPEESERTTSLLDLKGVEVQNQ